MLTTVILAPGACWGGQIRPFWLKTAAKPASAGRVPGIYGSYMVEKSRLDAQFLRPDAHFLFFSSMRATSGRRPARPPSRRAHR